MKQIDLYEHTQQLFSTQYGVMAPTEEPMVLVFHQIFHSFFASQHCTSGIGISTIISASLVAKFPGVSPQGPK